MLLITALIGGIFSFSFTTQPEVACEPVCSSPTPNLTIIKNYSAAEIQPYENYFPEFSAVSGMALAYEQSTVYLQVTGTLSQGGNAVKSAPLSRCTQCTTNHEPFVYPGLVVFGCIPCYLTNQVDPSQLTSVPLSDLIPLVPSGGLL